MMVGRRIESSFPPKPARAADAPRVLEVNELQIERGGGEPLHAACRRDPRLRRAGRLGPHGNRARGDRRDACARKDVRVRGTAAKLADPADALRAGIGILPESRKTEGLVTSFSIRDNISLNNLGKYRSMRWLIDRRDGRAPRTT